MKRDTSRLVRRLLVDPRPCVRSSSSTSVLSRCSLGVSILYTNCLRPQFLRLVETSEGTSQDERSCNPSSTVRVEDAPFVPSSGQEIVNRVHTITLRMLDRARGL